MRFMKKNIKFIAVAAVLLVLVIGLSVIFVTCSKKSDNSAEKNKFTAENIVSPEDVELPWEEGGKKPSEYTWEEFETLSGPQQMEFQKTFKSDDEFEKWMNKVKEENVDEENPWEKDGAKQPSEYSWEDFSALTGAQQIEFQRSFDSEEDFDTWLMENEPQ